MPRDSFAFPADGSIARTGALSTSVSARTGGAPAAHAVTDVLTGSLFNGEITWESAAGRAKSIDTTSDTVGSAIAGLVVLGQPVEAVPNQRVALADWGFLVTLEQALESAADADSRDARITVTALHVTLTLEHAGLPAGNRDPHRARGRRHVGPGAGGAGDGARDDDDHCAGAAGRAHCAGQAEAAAPEAA